MKVRAIQFSPALGNIEKNLEFHVAKIIQAIRAGQGICQKAKYIDEDVLDVEIQPADVRRARLSSNYLRDEQPQLVLRELQRILHA